MAKVIPRPKRQDGYLVCKECKCTVPYQGFDDPDLDTPWPEHRCLDRKIRPFTSWVKR